MLLTTHTFTQFYLIIWLCYVADIKCVCENQDGIPKCPSVGRISVGFPIADIKLQEILAEDTVCFPEAQGHCSAALPSALEGALSHRRVGTGKAGRWKVQGRNAGAGNVLCRATCSLVTLCDFPVMSLSTWGTLLAE